MSLPPRFRHGFGEVSEEDRKPEPQCNLQRETDSAGAGEYVANKKHRGKRCTHLHDKHDRVLQQVDRVQLRKGRPGGAADDFGVK